MLEFQSCAVLMKQNCAHRMWSVPEIKGISRATRVEGENLKLVSGCDALVVSIYTFSLCV